MSLFWDDQQGKVEPMKLCNSQEGQSCGGYSFPHRLRLPGTECAVVTEPRAGRMVSERRQDQRGGYTSATWLSETGIRLHVEDCET